MREKKLAICFVATNKRDEVIGYYTLSSQSLSSQRRKKLGEIFLLDALMRSLKISEKSLGAFAVVDPINEYAKTFYAQFGVIELLNSKKKFLPMKSIKKLF